MADLEKKWYVLRAIGGKEKKAKEYVEAEVAKEGYDEYVNQVLIPTEKVYQLRQGKKVIQERNYFPGYVLIEAALTGELIHILRNVTHIIGFLGETRGGVPLPIRESEVNRILGKVDELAESDVASTVSYTVEEVVKVTDGPFAGFTGTVEEVNEEKKKLKVVVKIFGRRTPFELSFMQVEKV